MIFTLTTIMFILLLIIGKKQGLKTIICFIINCLVIYSFIFFSLKNVNVILLSVLISIIIVSFTLFILNGINIKTKSSFISILITLFLIFMVVSLIVSKGNFQGFTHESRELIGTYSANINFDMSKLFVGIIIIASIGTVIDTSVSISTALHEIYLNNKTIKFLELFKSGISIGKDILSTTINTLVFIYFGAIITFISWNYNTEFYLIINHKMFGIEVVEFLVSIMGSVIIIPITSYIISYNLCNKKIYKFLK